MDTKKRIFVVLFLFLGFLLLGVENVKAQTTCGDFCGNVCSGTSGIGWECQNNKCSSVSGVPCHPATHPSVPCCSMDQYGLTCTSRQCSNGSLPRANLFCCGNIADCGQCGTCTPPPCNSNETTRPNDCGLREPFCTNQNDKCGKPCSNSTRRCYPKGDCVECDKTCPGNSRLQETTCTPTKQPCQWKYSCSGENCDTLTDYNCYPIGTCAPSCDLVVPSGYHFPQPGEITLCPHGTARCDINTNCGVFCREETATVYEDEPSIKPSPPINPKLKIDGYTYTLSTNENNWTRVRKPLPGKPEDAVKFSVTPQTPPSGTYRNPLFDFTAVFLGLSQGAQPLFATAKGAGDEKMFQALLRFSQQVSWILSLGVVAVCMAFPKLLASIFISGDPEVLKMTLTGLRLYSLGFLFLGFNLVGTIALQSAAKSKQAFIFAVARGMMMLIAFMLGLKSIIGILGVWLTFFASELVGFIWMNIMLANERKTPSSITAELQSR